VQQSADEQHELARIERFADEHVAQRRELGRERVRLRKDGDDTRARFRFQLLQRARRFRVRRCSVDDGDQSSEDGGSSLRSIGAAAEFRF